MKENQNATKILQCSKQTCAIRNILTSFVLCSEIAWTWLARGLSIFILISPNRAQLTSSGVGEGAQRTVDCRWNNKSSFNNAEEQNKEVNTCLIKQFSHLDCASETQFFALTSLSHAFHCANTLIQKKSLNITKRNSLCTYNTIFQLGVIFQVTVLNSFYPRMFCAKLEIWPVVFEERIIKKNLL